jgi:hypothetical protein
MMEGTAEQIDRRWAWGLLSLFAVGVAVWTALSMPVFSQKIEIAIDQEFAWGPDYVMGLFWWVVFAVAIFVFGGESTRMLQAAWLGKFLVTLVIMLFYERFYWLDSYSYYLLARTGEHWMYPGVDFRNDLMPSPFESEILKGLKFGGGVGLENTLRFTLLISLVSGPFFHALKVWMAFIGLMGVYCFYRAAVVAWGRPCPPIFFLLAFAPSLIFWGSTLGKDPMQFLCMGLYAYGGTLWIVEGRPAALPPLILGLFGCYLFRPWAGAMAAATLAFGILIGKCRWPQKVSMLVPLAVLSVVAVPMLASFGTQIDLTSFQVDTLLEIFETKAAGFSADTQNFGASGVNLLDDRGELRRLPIYQVMFGGLFRPLPFDMTNFATGLAALENTVVLIVAAIGLLRFRLVYLRNPIFLWLLLFTLMWSLMYGYIVLANFGSGARYKLQVWPFFLMLLVCLGHPEGRAWLASWTPEERRPPPQ